MGKRHTGRKLAMQLLYQAAVRKIDVDTVLADFWAHAEFDRSTQEWAEALSKHTWEKREDIDADIVRLAIDWEFGRINPVDKSILRIALYELKYTDTPSNIIIDEAVEIAKKYSTDDSPKFINGILGGFLNSCSPDSSKE